jgi:hypothetical protein
MAMLHDLSMPEREFLFYDVKDGWQPLRDHLGISVPEEAFPNADDWKKFKVQRSYEQ